MTDELRESLERLKALHDKATAPPWNYDGMHQEITTPRGDSYWLIVSECRSTPDQVAEQDEFGHQYDANFDLIAKLRNITPVWIDFALTALDMIGPHEQTCQVMMDHGTRGCRCGQDDLQAAAKRLLEGLR